MTNDCTEKRFYLVIPAELWREKKWQWQEQIILNDWFFKFDFVLIFNFLFCLFTRLFFLKNDTNFFDFNL